jgi:uncharacterized membrane protein YdcZ (DUF606 family)
MNPATIPARQEAAWAIAAANAFGRRHEWAQGFRGLNLGVSLCLPVIGAILAFSDHRTVFLTLFSAVWSVLAQLVLARLEDHFRLQGARAQECFDTGLFQLEWNSGIAGKCPSHQELIDWAGNRDDEDRHCWYAAPVAAAARPMDVLLCQQANVNWARRNHEVYRWLMFAFLVGLCVLTVVVGVCARVSLADYFLLLAVPALPAALICSRLIEGHLRQIELKGRIEDELQTDWKGAIRSAAAPDVALCRAHQDAIFISRAIGASIPHWFYSLKLDRDERSMQAAAQAMVDELPPSLRRGDDPA